MYNNVTYSTWSYVIKFYILGTNLVATFIDISAATKIRAGISILLRL